MASTAAFITAAKAKPFQIKEAPVYQPEEKEVLVKNHAVAINPVDGSLQTFAWYPVEYPTVLGCDVAGEVVSVGSDVTRFKKGDRVAGFAVGLSTKRLSDNAFQSHTILNEKLTSSLPDNISYEAAAVIPTGLATAACGLFQDAPFLQLEYPTEPARRPNGKVVLVWGGSSSVGSNAIQLARAAGYEVVSTASPRNFEYVKQLGASQVFDYNSSTISQDLVGALKEKEVAGSLDCIGGRALEVIVEVVRKTAGKGVIATTKGGVDDPPVDIRIGRIFGTTLKDNAVGEAIFADYLPKALATGSFAPSPSPEIVGHGLEHVQAAVDGIMKGVSAKKLVVTL